MRRWGLAKRRDDGAALTLVADRFSITEIPKPAVAHSQSPQRNVVIARRRGEVKPPATLDARLTTQAQLALIQGVESYRRRIDDLSGQLHCAGRTQVREERQGGTRTRPQSARLCSSLINQRLLATARRPHAAPRTPPTGGHQGARWDEGLRLSPKLVQARFGSALFAHGFSPTPAECQGESALPEKLHAIRPWRHPRCCFVMGRRAGAPVCKHGVIRR